MVLGRKTNFFVGKPKNQFFPKEKDDFVQKKQLFPRKKNCFYVKNQIFLGKRWFLAENQFFPRENQKNYLFRLWPHNLPKIFIFLFFGFSLGKNWFSYPKPSFSKEKVGFSHQNHLFPREKFAFLSKIIFFLGKSKKPYFWNLAA